MKRNIKTIIRENKKSLCDLCGKNQFHARPEYKLLLEQSFKTGVGGQWDDFKGN